jgi:hypothetical protein
MNDLITQILKKYFLQRGKTLEVIQRYLSIRYKLHIDEKLLEKRLSNIS